MTNWDFLLLTFSVAALLEAWTRGSLFANWRAYLEECTGFIPELLRCAFCLSYHLPWVGILYLMLLDRYTDHWAMIPLYSLTITFIVNRLRRMIEMLEYIGKDEF